MIFRANCLHINEAAIIVIKIASNIYQILITLHLVIIWA